MLREPGWVFLESSYAIIYALWHKKTSIEGFVAYFLGIPCRDPWVLPTEASARKAAALLRARLAREAGGSSDHLATVRAFNGWKAAKTVS